MKTFVAIVVVALVAIAQANPITDEQRAKAKQLIQECIQQTGVSANIVDQFRAGNYPDNATTKQYVHCVFGKAHFINEAGEPQADNIKKYVPAGPHHDEIASKIDECLQQRGTDANDSAYKWFVCARNSNVPLLLADS